MQGQVTEEGEYERRMPLYNWFLWVVHEGVLDTELNNFQ
jgi:hypothetical protein